MAQTSNAGGAGDGRPRFLRPWLDGFFTLWLGLAAVSMIAIATVVIASALARLVGGLVPSSSALSGYFVAASAFFALGPTLRRDGHIRVTLLLGAVPKRFRRWLEGWALLLGLGMSLFLTLWLGVQVGQSIQFGDVSQGLLAIPLWIPQTAMVLGAFGLVVAFLESLLVLIRTGAPAYWGETETPVTEREGREGLPGKRGT